MRGGERVRNLSKLIFQRVVGVSLAILLQIIFVLAGMSWLYEYRRWLGIAMGILSWVAVIGIICGRSNPSYKIAWIVLILAFPVAGLTVYLLFGGNKVSSHETRKMASVDRVTTNALRQDPAVLAAIEARQDEAYNHARYLLSCAHYPAYAHSQATYFSGGEDCFAAMLEELERAQHYIFLEFFIIGRGRMWDSIRAILVRKAAQGVDVRVLYDDFGCITRLPMGYAKKLGELGIRAHAVNPYLPILSGRLNNRDHRKLMIIDGRAAFTGGVNLADEYINVTHPYGHWKDCGILVRGEAAWSMAAMFLSFWGYVDRQTADITPFRAPAAGLPSDGFLQPFADSPLDRENVGATIFQSLIRSARNYVWIMTPYLILDDEMTSALCTAARTGIDVRIVTPGVPDKWYVHAVTRANYEALTEAGVKIYEYTPGFIHSKVCLADGRYALVGTVNLDFRSLYLHFEDGVYLCGSSAIDDVYADFEETFPKCELITYAACKHTRIHQRLLRTLLRLFSPLL